MFISKRGYSKARLQNCFLRNSKTATSVVCVYVVAKTHICLMSQGRAGGDNGKTTFDFSFLTEPGQAEMDTSAVDCRADTQ